MKLLQILSIALVGLLAMQCGDSTTENTTPAPVTQVQADTFPSIPIPKLQDLWENCDYIDYVFYQLPISMSLDQDNSIKYALSHISSSGAPKKPECKSIGRVFYQVKGENQEEAELYFSEGCTFFVFLENGKPKYGNYMTPTGAQYLNNTFQSASGNGQ